MVSTLDPPAGLRSGRSFKEEAVLDRDAAAKYHGRAYSRPRSEQQHSRHPCPARADAGSRSALVAGDGSRRNWNPDRGRKVAPQKRRRDASRTRPRKPRCRTRKSLTNRKRAVFITSATKSLSSPENF